MAKKHATEVAIDKCSVMTRITLVNKYKLLKLFGGDDAPVAKCVSLAIDELVKDIQLDDKDWDRINAEMKANFDKRMANREKVRAENLEAERAAKKARR